MTKSKARKHFLKLRASLPPEDIDRLSAQIARRVIDNFGDVRGVWHVFLTIEGKSELDTRLLVELLRKKGNTLATSVTNLKSNELSHHRYDEETALELNSWGIPEPVDSPEVDFSDIDVVLVPLLAFDKLGHRVGYGKGYYDRFLNELKPGALKIGLSLFDPIESIDDVWEGDIPLSSCVTPDKVYTF